MEETSSQVVKFINDITCKEKAMDTVDQSSENFSMANSSKTSYMDFLFSKTPLMAGESGLNDSISDGLLDKIRQGFESCRFYNKQKKVWSNRGLSLDRKSLESETAKDTFNMRNLRNALPSSNPIPMSYRMRGMRRRPDPALKVFLASERQKRTANRSFSSKAVSSEENTVKEYPHGSSSLSAKLSLGSRILSLNKENVSDMSKRERLNEYMETFQGATCQALETSCQPSFCPEFAKMSLDDDQEEATLKRQNSDFEYESSLNPPPRSKILEDAGWSFSDSERNLPSGFEVPAPFNSPNKEDRFAVLGWSPEVREKARELSEWIRNLKQEERQGRQDSDANNNQQNATPAQLSTIVINRLNSDLDFGRNRITNLRNPKVHARRLECPMEYELKIKIVHSKSIIQGLRNKLQKLNSRPLESIEDKWKIDFLNKSLQQEKRTLHNYRMSIIRNVKRSFPKWR